MLDTPPSADSLSCLDYHDDVYRIELSVSKTPSHLKQLYADPSQ